MKKYSDSSEKEGFTTSWWVVSPLYCTGKIIDVFVDEPIPFEEIDRDKTVIVAQDLRIAIVSIHHLKKLKRISGRPQDLADIEALEALEETE